MRTSIPHGMNEPNRIHPFFIILRHYSEEEEVRSKKMIEWFMAFAIALWIMCVSLLVILNDHKGFVEGLPWLVGIIVGYIFMLYGLIKEMRLVMKNCTFPEVNKMLHSDDYSTADLNYERVYNMTCTCADNVGEITILTRLYRIGLLICCATSAYMMFFFILGRVLGGT